jgi:hypothetical protein
MQTRRKGYPGISLPSFGGGKPEYAKLLKRQDFCFHAKEEKRHFQIVSESI